MRNNYADKDATPSFDNDAQPSGTPAVVTVAADAEQFWVLDWISWSYDSTPTSGNLKVEIGGTTVWQVDITSGGPGHIEFDKPLYVPTKNQSLVVTLADGTVANKVNIRYR